MWYSRALDRLQAIGQDHLLAGWESLSDSQKQQLLENIEALNLRQMDVSTTLPAEVTPHAAVQPASVDLGKALVREGRVGCIVLSGGQGSRLQFPLPKGMFPITPIQQKSLYQYLAEKVVAASQQAERPLQVAFMTSTQKRDVIHSFFAEHEFFGLGRQQIDFFAQGDLPFLDQQGHMFFAEQATPAVGPNGNGGLLDAFVTSPIFAKWLALGIRYVQIIQIDNPLADPFDPELVGIEGYDMVLKAIPRADPQEKVGVIAKRKNKPVVVEYTDIPESMRTARETDGSLVYPLANITHFLIAMDALSLAHAEGPLPIHRAWKDVVAWDSSKGFTKQHAWKYEMFLFDILPRLRTVAVQCSPRNSCFAPLKNQSGPDSIYSVQQTLEERDRAQYRHLFAHDPPDTPLELHPKFYYPTEQLVQEWQSKPFPANGYLA